MCVAIINYTYSNSSNESIPGTNNVEDAILTEVLKIEDHYPNPVRTEEGVEREYEEGNPDDDYEDADGDNGGDENDDEYDDEEEDGVL